MFVLASNSPRRKDLLSISGCEFQVRPAEIDEDLRPGETAVDYVRRLAEKKARAVASSLPGGPEGPAWTAVIAADTTVVDPHAEPSQSILAKPGDSAEAEWMLLRLRGRTHQVYTGIAVLRAATGELRTAVCCTHVKMRPYSAAEMSAYIDSRDPLDKAGGYAIQHSGFQPVESVTGCYANVVGLPLCCLAQLLEELDLPQLPNLPAACQEDLQQEQPVFRPIIGQPSPIPGI